MPSQKSLKVIFAIFHVTAQHLPIQRTAFASYVTSFLRFQVLPFGFCDRLFGHLIRCIVAVVEISLLATHLDLEIGISNMIGTVVSKKILLNYISSVPSFLIGSVFFRRPIFSYNDYIKFLVVVS